MNFNIFLCFLITFTEVFDGEYIESADCSGSRSISASHLDVAMGCISVPVLSLISASCFLLYESSWLIPMCFILLMLLQMDFFCDFFFRNANDFVCLFCTLYLATLLKLCLQFFSLVAVAWQTDRFTSYQPSSTLEVVRMVIFASDLVEKPWSSWFSECPVCNSGFGLVLILLVPSSLCVFIILD